MFYANLITNLWKTDIVPNTCIKLNSIIMFTWHCVTSHVFFPHAASLRERLKYSIYMKH